jgi:uncharacterized protein YndB with AHSA1/START domain
VGRSNTIDELYIEASPARVFDALARLGIDRSWWPGARASRDGDRLAVDAPSLHPLSRRVRFEARVDGVRPGEGIVWRIERGEVHGRGEFWLEPFKDGTIVHYYLDVDAGETGRARRMTSRVRRHRWAVRRGVNALKERLEVRV